MGDFSQYFLIGGTMIVGLVATVIYYVARYTFSSHADDPEVLPSLKKKLEIEKAKATTDEVVVDQQKVATQSDPVKIVEEQKQATKEVPRKDLKEALANTKANMFGRFKQTLVGKSTLSDDDIEVLEEVLYTSDMGPQTVQRLMSAVGEKLEGAEKKQLSAVQAALKDEMTVIFNDVNPDELQGLDDHFKLDKSGQSTKVWMVVGVNGAGKTTSIGKLAYFAAQKGYKVLVAAGDTFRAAAGEQLKTWTERAKVEIFFPQNVTDPSAVAFDACQKGVAGQFDLVIIDTAGRLHTQDNLMEELKKMKRVIKKVIPEGPDQTLIVLDANSGQNALLQAKNFNQALGLSGAILTKLDGTAKGGVAIGLACELSLPIRAIGVGEGIEDIRAFESKEFVDSII